MHLTVPASGTLELRFQTTPARRLGAIASGATLALLVLGTLVRRRLTPG